MSEIYFIRLILLKWSSEAFKILVLFIKSGWVLLVYFSNFSFSTDEKVIVKLLHFYFYIQSSRDLNLNRFLILKCDGVNTWEKWMIDFEYLMLLGVLLKFAINYFLDTSSYRIGSDNINSFAVTIASNLKWWERISELFNVYEIVASIYMLTCVVWKILPNYCVYLQVF